jgi:hypothetical protein
MSIEKMKFDVGDVVHIRSREYLVEYRHEGITVNEAMFSFAGKVAVITREAENYKIDLDDGEWAWASWMFEEGPRFLSKKEVLEALLAGEILIRENGMGFRLLDIKIPALFRGPVKKKRLMTRWEALGWASSEESRGWVIADSGRWAPPQSCSYSRPTEVYSRARLLPDLSGIDEATVQGFEVEE